MAEPTSYHKQNTSYSPEAAQIVKDWMARTGKGWSETVSLLIVSGDGNLRLLRHPMATHLQALSFSGEYYRRVLQQPEHAEIHVSHRSALDALERLLAPPTPAARNGAAQLRK